jgi:hypothetical protein
MRKALIIIMNALFVCLVVFITVAQSAQTEPTSLAERRAQLAEAIDGFPEDAQGLLRSVVLSDDFVGVFSAEQTHELSALMGLSANETALALISLARVYAVPPISNVPSQDPRRIKRAVLVQTSPDTASQKDATQAVLSVLAESPELEVYAAVPE